MGSLRFTISTRLLSSDDIVDSLCDAVDTLKPHAYIAERYIFTQRLTKKDRAMGLEETFSNACKPTVACKAKLSQLTELPPSTSEEQSHLLPTLTEPLTTLQPTLIFGSEPNQEIPDISEPNLNEQNDSTADESFIRMSSQIQLKNPKCPMHRLQIIKTIRLVEIKEEEEEITIEELPYPKKPKMTSELQSTADDVEAIESINSQKYTLLDNIWMVSHALKLPDIPMWLYKGFQQGCFGIKRTSKPFSRQPIDLVLEQTINAVAARRLTGVIHFTNSISARQRWARNHDHRSSKRSINKYFFGKIDITTG
ncbi:unnamed protein product [Brassicogethes aeneus]|uniref:Uncharacterized protein n=1 Tax=Brassicogethes aeneus TaxID=1431903 RepID=A0A9P0BBR0_BRAAE|nr:unnamed protein product [Brassicogethes aeneus]